MKKLKIRPGDLEMAMDNSFMETDHYLNTETGRRFLPQI